MKCRECGKEIYIQYHPNRFNNGMVYKCEDCKLIKVPDKINKHKHGIIHRGESLLEKGLWVRYHENSDTQ